MATIKLTQFFSAGKLGWTETWYKTAENPDAVLAAAAELASARIKLLASEANGPRLDYWRLSDDDIFGDALFRIGPGLNTYDKVENLADVQWTGWLVRIESGSRYRRMFIVRGCPDTDFRLNPNGTEIPAFRKVFQKYFDVLQGGGWSLRVWSKEGGNPEVPVTAVGLVPPNIVVTAPGLVTAIGDLVQLRGFGRATHMNGTKRAIIANATGVTFTQGAELLDFVLDGRQRARKRVRFVANLTAFEVLRYAHRDTGRPFGLLRGRQSKRVV